MGRLGAWGLLVLLGCNPTPGVLGGQDEAGVSADAETVDAAAETVDGAVMDARPRPDGPSCIPQPEICNGLDEDCDGQIDEDARDAGGACEEGLGACSGGTLVCRVGELVCEGVGLPQPEICNDLDDDCDGDTDEEAADVGEACDAGPEACGPGTLSCEAGSLLCVAPMEGGAELCNGLDDDCDGAVDEGVRVGTACGACGAGATVCTGGEVLCEGDRAPEEEDCNGVDDDCDGEVDEEARLVGDACDAGEACGGVGALVCDQGVLNCGGVERPEAEDVCNGVDDDCDGRLDEAEPSEGEACGDDVGACEPGALRCLGGMMACIGGTSPVPEACDTLDNDCDGQADEADDVGGGGPCPGLGDPCGGNGLCPSGLCFNDRGQPYCSRECEVEAEDCGEGLRCELRAGRNVCARIFPACLTQRDCPADEICRLLPPRSPDELGAECRPPLADGVAAGEACGQEVALCASGMCLSGLQECSQLCVTPDECPQGFNCALTPFVMGNGDAVDLGICLRGCGGDVDCGEASICQYGLQADREAVVGYCDEPFDGVATGEFCDLGADPPIDCDHGYCRRDGEARYCTQGCAEDAHCPEGWACEQTPLRNSDLSLGLCRR